MALPFTICSNLKLRGQPWFFGLLIPAHVHWQVLFPPPRPISTLSPFSSSLLWPFYSRPGQVLPQLVVSLPPFLLPYGACSTLQPKCLSECKAGNFSSTGSVLVVCVVCSGFFWSVLVLRSSGRVSGIHFINVFCNRENFLVSNIKLFRICAAKVSTQILNFFQILNFLTGK